jgi:hypothetical protein
MATEEDETPMLVVGWIFFVINIIFTCILCRGTYMAHQRRNQVQWSARHFRPLFYALCWSILFISVERNLQLMGSILGLFEWPFVLGWAFNNVFLVTFLALYIVRTWLIHYDYHSGIALHNLVTNPDMSDDVREHMQWFMDNKVNYGSPKYLIRFTFAMILVINLFFIAWSALSPVSFIYGMVLIYIGFVLVCISITNKLVELNDTFVIRDELVHEYRMFAVMLILAGIWVCFGAPMGWRWGTFLLVETSVFAVFGMGLAATWRVLKQTQMLGFERELTLADGAYPLDAVLVNAEANGLFIEHLTREIMVENIFFLSDVMAFKESFVQYNKLEEVQGFRCQIPTSLSRLMFRRTFTHYAWAITKTYVDGTSAFFVTAISEQTRERCIEFFEEQNPADEKRNQTAAHYAALQVGFDEAAQEVLRVLKDSYMRWSHLESYKDVNIRGQSMGVNQEMKERLAARGTNTN